MMKVLIVDDEEHVREGIDLAIDWEKFGIIERLQAEDGSQAIDLLRRHRPAVMFCDMRMPGMDGAELLHRLREEGFDTQIIVVSGHEDYHFTRAAIRANGLDYLLKPLSKRALEQALETAAMTWKNRELSMRKERDADFKIKRADAFVDEQKLAAYLKGEAGFQEGLRGLLHKVGLSSVRLRAALILPCNRKELVERRFKGDRELFVFAINNIAHESLRAYGAHYLCRFDDYQWVLLVSLNGSSRSAAEHRRCMSQVTAAWKNILNLDTIVGTSASEVDIARLPNAVSEARSALLMTDIGELQTRMDTGALRAFMDARGSDDLESRGAEAIRAYMEQHYQEDVSLTVLSEYFYFSPQHIAKKFKEVYHMTVMTYLTEIRMNKAKPLLRFTDMPVAEIANSVGYSDDNYFGKVFKKLNGVSPLHYRKLQRDS